MPHLKSLYPPIPDIDIPNYYDFMTGLEQFKTLPDYTLFIDGLTGEKQRLRAFFERVDACATALASSSAVGGLNALANPNEIVGIFSENSMEWPTLVYSCLKLGVPFALLPAYSTAAEFRHLLKTSESTRLFVSPSVFETAFTVAREVGLPEDRVYVLQGRVPGRTSLADLIQNARARGLSTVPSRRMHSNHIACLGFSSGTSGLPKAVMISHKNLYYSLMQTITIGREFVKGATSPPPNTAEGVPCAVAFMPYYHVTAFHLCMMRIFTPPCTIIILPRWKLDTVLDALQKYDVTNFGLVPSMAHEVINSPRFQTTDFSKVASFTSGAAQLPLEHRRAILERMPQVQFAMAYGMTECTFLSLATPLSGLFPGRFNEHQMLTMTGILLPGCEARIMREDESEAGYDEPGELLARGGHAALGYWKNEAATRGSFLPGGWLRTGDQFTVDRQGAFYYLDRLKDTLKISGAQVSPVEIEDALRRHPDALVVDVTVAGVPGGRISDERVPRAWVVLSDAGKRRGEAATLAALDAWSHTQLARHKQLRGGLEVVDQIPKTHTGKVMRRVLQEQHVAKLKAKAQAKL